MSDWSTIFLGIIAVSSLTVAAIQVGVLIVAAAGVKKLTQGIERAETKLMPLMTRVEALGEQASDVMVKVVSGLERTERAVEAVGSNVTRATHAVGDRLRTPVGEVSALLAGVRAAADSLGRATSAPRHLDPGARAAAASDWMPDTDERLMRPPSPRAKELM